ncbi:cation-translocating P-type ATPase [Pseudochrobactrum sp. XF203]|uniref:cation-translocating P-type ATPase n=1 Tax=Pseudochrobactrum sp. XF203 TaxID=2879116 RepID=UPI001CE3B3A7|nr:cation-translocating P-type ATPase [Pseudochrobactrum sp. XF203]UCA45935.1 cadmium-translocating P-type ATPase [Pseudochrobactrum sp. XF203]
MSCCGSGIQFSAADYRPEELLLASRTLGDGQRQLDLSVPSVHCGLCIQTVETALNALPEVSYARVNLSSKRVSVRWKDGIEPPHVIDALQKAGYPAHIFELGDDKDPQLSRLLIALAVAGFASMNIMLFSVSVWSGADAATRDMFHWLSGLIALPTLVYSGRIFYMSAWNALKHGRSNMDVPISLAITLAFVMSVYETLNSGQHAYFDASATLLFFLLIGRTLDHVMRERARSAVKGLSQLAARGAVVIGDDNQHSFMPIADIRPSMRIILAVGERVPVDAVVESGRSDLDCSIATGESVPVPVTQGSKIRAGTMNLAAPLTIKATASADSSFLAEMVRLMDAAEGGRARYRQLADRASALYVPLVHTTAFLAFVVWLYLSGDWYKSTYVAITTLIITCPCALALAVPIVQVVAARRLFENGIMVKDGSAMERMAEIDSVMFDKTGTLTLGQPQLMERGSLDQNALELAAELALYSRHPLSRALTAFTNPAKNIRFDLIEEVSGAGIEARMGQDIYRLGRRDWAVEDVSQDNASTGTETVLSRNGTLLEAFRFEDSPRDDAARSVQALKDEKLSVEILSGDKEKTVSALARQLGIEKYRAEILPAHKSELVTERTNEGHKVLMVGDGLNDAPALMSAYVSMAPATAADIGRNAADFVFLHDSLTAVPLAVAISREAGKLIRQNFALSLIYNIIAVPIALFGYVTPLIAALSMSLSSILVVSNALRLKAGKKQGQKTASPLSLLKRQKA